MCHCTETFLKISPQKFRRVRKEDAGEYYCQAKNDAGHAHCPAQMMEVCECLNVWVSVFRGHFCDLLTSKNKTFLCLIKQTVLQSLARLANKSRWGEQVIKGKIMVKHINTTGRNRSSKMTWGNMGKKLKKVGNVLRQSARSRTGQVDSWTCEPWTDLKL